MGSITPFVSTANGYVRLEVDWTSHPTAQRCTVWRLVNGLLTLVRDCDPLLLSNSKAVVYDTEMPLDVPVRYRTQIALNPNGSFEESMDEWVTTTNLGSVGTISRSSDYFVVGRGNWSLKVTQAASVATIQAASDFIPATAGVSYTLSGYLMVPAAWAGGIGVQIEWFNGTTPISTSGVLDNLWPTPGVFELDTLTATAPGTTTQMKIVAAMTGTPTSATPLFADEMFVVTAATTVDASADVVVSGEGGGWWKDPLHPAVNARMVVDLDESCLPLAGIAMVGFTDPQSRPADSAIQEVNDSPQGIGVWSKRKAIRSSFQVVTRTLNDRDQINALHSAGGPTLVQVPANYGEDDRYILCGDTTEGRITQDHRVQWRVFRTPFSEVLQPVGPADGVFGTRYQDLTKFATFGDATAASVTWVDALQGELTL